MCKCEGTKNLITAKTVLQCRRLKKARKGILNAKEAKKGKSKNHCKVQCVMYRLEQVPKVVVQKQAKGKW